MKLLLAVLLVALCLAEAKGQECVGEEAECEDGGLGCCSGYCQRRKPSSVCVRAPDSWAWACDSNSICQSGMCNSRGYCGCIKSGLLCTEGKSEECCGRNGVKNCSSSSSIFLGFGAYCY